MYLATVSEPVQPVFLNYQFLKRPRISETESSQIVHVVILQHPLFVYIQFLSDRG